LSTGIPASGAGGVISSGLIWWGLIGQIMEMMPRTCRQLLTEIISVLKGNLPRNWVNREDILKRQSHRGK
jgi:hypothetical protein